MFGLYRRREIQVSRPQFVTKRDIMVTSSLFFGAENLCNGSDAAQPGPEVDAVLML